MNSKILRVNKEFLGLDTYINWYNENPLMEEDETIMRIVKYHTSGGYTCLRPPGAAGAIIVPGLYDGVHNQTVLIGCAEPPVGRTCKEIGACEMENGHCVRTIHAEVNAILLAAYYGISLQRATIYSLLKPCYQCTKAIITAGIRRIVYAGKAYDEERTRNLIDFANIECDHVDINLEYGNDA